MPQRIYTIGHSKRSLDELLAVLASWKITRLVDIRTIPRSATNPQFNADTLPAALAGSGIEYTLSRDLGGRRPKSKTIAPEVNAGWQVQAFHNYADYALTLPFRAALKELIAMAAKDTCAIMCAEAVWWRCHRRIVTDHLLARGVEVMHIASAEKATPATPTPFAQLGERRRITYPEP